MRAVCDRGAARCTNSPVATRPGTDPTGTIVLATYIDSAPDAPGAADAGIGLSVILETVRALGPETSRNDLVVGRTRAGGLPHATAAAQRRHRAALARV